MPCFVFKTQHHTSRSLVSQQWVTTESCNTQHPSKKEYLGKHKVNMKTKTRTLNACDVSGTCSYKQTLNTTQFLAGLTYILTLKSYFTHFPLPAPCLAFIKNNKAREKKKKVLWRSRVTIRIRFIYEKDVGIITENLNGIINMLRALRLKKKKLTRTDK